MSYVFLIHSCCGRLLICLVAFHVVGMCFSSSCPATHLVLAQFGVALGFLFLGEQQRLTHVLDLRQSAGFDHAWKLDLKLPERLCRPCRKELVPFSWSVKFQNFLCCNTASIPDS
ncbi:UNVERIFIED_CONTAM: hypothetical protein K2H54_037004 [Gekko kuhli]